MHNYNIIELFYRWVIEQQDKAMLYLWSVGNNIVLSSDV